MAVFYFMEYESIKELLRKNPEVSDIKNYNGADYIPIGQVEEILDSVFTNWEAYDFKFQIIRTDKFWFADASVVLQVFFEHPASLTKSFSKRLPGAVTFHISSKDVNMDYSGTALSLCISNAAKKLGRRMGRALNNRLTVGDVLPVIRADKKVPISEEKNRTMLLIKQTKTVEKLQEWILLAKQHKLMRLYNSKLKELSK